ncbi:glycosyltransferase [Elizabethkingia anophelis]|uniref:glycosyltransferase n=1 Tax=Elizabethkingia TaxID=308865 RepID=UPI0007398BD2|nr:MULTISPECIES: glycosyltransferase [Elizabethkingia]KUF46363.1 capsular biosynthesis protein [Elizabethkingia anophelis]MCT3643453.1 glycosyltransferase [Elizabethkingia anophelis]MCT3650295.1 glycosyltransferase [Elizabethkingia anophelis]MCT3653912.1 glycosyltransferase [Elizabethkingia anophelis]MCT3657707.1 glycosyltransferase [Elizabethkingia anophelis]
MIRVLHIVTRIDVGGLTTFLFNYYQNMDHNLIQFDIVAIDTGAEQDYHEKFKALGVRVQYMPDNLLSRLKFLCTLMKYGEYDIVHDHSELPSAIYLLLAKLNGVKVRIAHAHLSVPTKGIKNSFLRILLNNVVTQRIGASSYSVKALFGEQYINSSIILNNAIDVSMFSFNEKKREEYRKELLLHEKYVIGFVGRLTFLKNIFYLLEILSELIAENSDILLLIVGDGELGDEFKKRAVELGVNNNILMLGQRSDINFLMMAMDVLLLPSFHEGLPLVLIEAQAATLKAIVSDNVSKEVKISDYLLFESIDKNPKVWRDIIIDKCQDYVRQPIDELIREKQFDIKEEVKRLMQLYKYLIEK